MMKIRVEVLEKSPRIHCA